MAASSGSYGEIYTYSPPTWAKDLKLVPSSHMKLRMSPTPIHKWTPPNIPDGFEVSIKREDLTGSTLSGNKVRKLEFILSDARQQGCDTVLTMGGFQSNHARATAIAARELGMEPYVFALNFTPEKSKSLTCDSNLLLMRLVGTKFVLYPWVESVPVDKQLKEMQQDMERYAEKLSAEGHKACVIPKGGSSILGTWGYIDAFDEMMKQGVLNDFDDIVCAAGCIGTVSGLAISNYLTGSKLKIHAICIAENEQTVYKEVDSDLQELGLTDVCAKDIIDPIANYIAIGYGKSTDEQLEAIVDVMSHTGISLDPDFTVKTYLGMVGEMKTNPSRFKGHRVLYVHTGGVFLLFDGRINKMVERSDVCNKTIQSSDLFS